MAPDPSPPLDRVLPQHGLLQVPQHAAPFHLCHPHPLGKQGARLRRKRGLEWRTFPSPKGRLLCEQTHALDVIPLSTPQTHTSTAIQATASQEPALNPPLS